MPVFIFRYVIIYIMVKKIEIKKLNKKNPSKLELNIHKIHIVNSIKELEWKDSEKGKLGKRILTLRKDQLGALFYLVKIIFSKTNITHIVEEMIKYKSNSIYLDILLCEADSKENLLWWVKFFEKYNSAAPSHVSVLTS